MIGKITIFVLVTAGVGVSDILDRRKLWTDEEVDAAARKWSERSVKERGAASQHEALAEWKAAILNSGNLPQDKRIELLGSALRKISMFNIFQVAERIEVYDLAQEKLLSIPGHAIYFRDRINEAKEKVRKGEMSLNDWSTLLSNTSQTLRHMPSEETVRVLGELTQDPFGLPWAKNPGDYQNIPGIQDWDNDMSSAGSARLSSYACSTLENMGIEPLPYPTGPDAPVTILRQNEWEKWFAKVNSGNLRYRFKGSDVLHPVDLPPGAERKPRRPERGETPEEREPQQNSSAPASEEPAQPAESPKWPLVAGIVLLILAVSSLAIKRLLKPK